jgi:hypothetical protein
MKRVVMPVHYILVEEPFSQWRLDVIAPLNPKSSKGHSCIVIATNYFTNWKEVVALRKF